MDVDRKMLSYKNLSTLIAEKDNYRPIVNLYNISLPIGYGTTVKGYILNLINGC